KDRYARRAAATEPASPSAGRRDARDERPGPSDAARADPARAAAAAELAARHGLRPNDADALAGSAELRAFFEASVAASAPAGAAANLVVNEVARELRARGESLRLTPAGLAGLARLLDEGRVT